MKKIIILAVMAALITSVCNAQLYVKSNGRVSINTDQSPRALFTIKGNHASSSNTNDGPPFNAEINVTRHGALSLVTDTATCKDAWYAQYSRLESSYNTPIGLYSIVKGLNSNRVTGIKNYVYGGNSCYSIFGGLSSTSTMTNGVGIFGSTISTEITPGGIYAGYFYGDVKATGTIYGTLVSPSSVSSPSQGGTTINLSEEATRGESITGKLRQVDLLQMERVNQDGSVAANKVVEKETILDENGEDVSAEEPIQTKLPSISYGLAADQLKEVFPELVYEDKDGNYSINYVEMVPLLVQSIKELSAKVEALEAERDNPKAIKAKSSQMDIADNVNISIPDKAQKIQLNIYDLSGKQVRATDVNESGDVRLSTYTKGLPTGTYAYSLIVDGRKQKTRKIMVK